MPCNIKVTNGDVHVNQPKGVVHVDNPAYAAVHSSVNPLMTDAQNVKVCNFDTTTIHDAGDVTVLGAIDPPKSGCASTYLTPSADKTQWVEGGITNVALGCDAGNSQVTDAIAVGNNAGAKQSSKCIAIGTNAGGDSQGDSAIAIGFNSGKETSKGDNKSIAIGAYSSVQSIGEISLTGGWDKTIAPADAQQKLSSWTIPNFQNEDIKPLNGVGTNPTTQYAILPWTSDNSNGGIYPDPLTPYKNGANQQTVLSVAYVGSWGDNKRTIFLQPQHVKASPEIQTMQKRIDKLEKIVTQLSNR